MVVLRSVGEPENVVGSVKDVLSRLFMLCTCTLVEVNTIPGGADCYLTLFCDP